MEPKDNYDEEGCVTWEKGMVDIGGTDYDVACVKWGGGWRMPTRDDFQELIDNCGYEWVKQDGNWGARFTSKKNGGSIFFPAGGEYSGDYIDYFKGYGWYWSCTSDGNLYQGASDFCFNKEWCYIDWSLRYVGYLVRPVINRGEVV